MANYCENHLTITGPLKDLEAFRDCVVGIDDYQESDKPNQLCFAKIVPMPKILMNSSDVNETDRWMKINWGSYSEASDVEYDLFSCPEGTGQLVYEFLTKYLPPKELIHTASARYPNLLFSLIAFIEDGRGGLYIARRGRMAVDTSIEYDVSDKLDVLDGGDGYTWRFLLHPKASD